MPSTHTRRLTAQEAFEQEGFIMGQAYFAPKPGDIVENNGNPDSMVPLGTKLVVTGIATEKDAEKFCARVGWRYNEEPGLFFYKAVAE